MKTVKKTGRPTHHPPSLVKGDTSKALPSTGRSVGQWILFAYLLLSPLFFWRDSIDPFDFQKLLLLKVTLVALAGCWFWRGLPSFSWSALRDACREPITLGFLLFWCSAVLSTATSLHPELSWQGAYFSYGGLGTFTAFMLLFLFTRWLIHSPEDAGWLLRAGVIAAPLTAGYAVIQALGLDPLSWFNTANIGSYNRPIGTLGHANLLAAYLAMAFPLAVWYTAQAWTQEKRKRAVALGGIALLLIVALMLTLCRGGWLAWLATLPLLAVGFGLHRSWRSRAGKYLLGILALSGVALTGMIAWGPPAFRQSFVERWQQFSEPSGRFELWRAAWQIFQDHPVTGAGLETFSLTFPPHRTMAYWQIEGGLTHHRTHNEPLHILATQGILGLAAWLLIGFGLLRAVVRLGRWVSGQQRQFLLVLTAAVVAFYVQNLFFFTMVAYGSLFVTLAAVLANWSQQVAQKENAAPSKAPAASHPRWCFALRLAGGVALMLIFVQGVVQPWQADYWCFQGEESLRQGDALAALECFRQAQAIQPSDLEMPTRCGQAAEQAGMNETEPPQRQALLREALAAYDTAVERVPQRAEYYAHRARIMGLMAREGRTEATQVITAYEQALQRDPNQVGYYVDASRVAMEMGETTKAAEFARRGLLRAPRYGPLQAQQAVIALRTGKVAEALTALNDLTQYQWDTGENWQNARCAKAEALVRLGKHEAALRITSSLCRQRPDWSAPLYLEALALEGLGRSQEAARHYETILGREPQHAPAYRGWQRVRGQSRK